MRQTTNSNKRKLARVHAEAYIKNTDGKFFTAVFKKKDGSKRVMNGRIGVTRYLKGGENKVVRPDNSYITMFDVHAQGYRTLNLATLEELHLNGAVYKVVD
jgi:hypothetical protein